jgi:transcriptional regulator with XRE-family HTH domain
MAMFKHMGLALRVLRELKGVSQAGLARQAGLGKSQLSKYESGKDLPIDPAIEC